MTPYIYDYYTVKVPGDLDDNLHDLADHAIQIARDRAKLYCTPCNWTAWLVSGGIGDFEVTFRVRRTRWRKDHAGITKD